MHWRNTPQPGPVTPLRACRNYRRDRWQWALCVLLATATLASARSDDGPTVKVSTTSSASISLDGLLNEPAWRDAPVMKLVQQAPKPGQPTPYETQVRVVVTSDRLYLGFTCKDPDPRRIAIHTMRRDGVVPLIYLIFRVGWQETVSSFANPRTIRAVEVSLLTSFISVSVMTFFGVPLGYLLARPGFKGRQLLISLVFVPMALPPLVGGVLLLLVYGPYGLVGALFEKHGVELVNSLAGIVLAQVFVAAPYVVIASISAFGRVDERLEKASAVLGANQWRTFRKVSLTLAWPGIMAGVMLAWVRTLGEFGATLVMAYHPNTVPVFLWVQLTSEGLTAALPLALFLVVLGLVAVCAVYFFGQFTSTDSPQRVSK